jgi:hypothetical protein
MRHVWSYSIVHDPSIRKTCAIPIGRGLSIDIARHVRILCERSRHAGSAFAAELHSLCRLRDFPLLFTCASNSSMR